MVIDFLKPPAPTKRTCCLSVVRLNTAHQKQFACPWQLGLGTLVFVFFFGGVALGGFLGDKVFFILDDQNGATIVAPL